MDESIPEFSVNDAGTDTGPVDNSTGQEPSGGGDNPAWEDFLTIIPGALHEPVKNRLRDWDSGVQQRIQKVHSEYEPYKPFKEQGIGTEDLTASYQLFQAFNNDPMKVYEGLTQFLRESGQLPPEQGQEPQQNADEGYETQEFDLSGDPVIQQMQQQQQQLAQFLENQQNEKLRQQAESELDTALNAVNERFGGKVDDAGMKYILNVSMGLLDQHKGDINKAITAAADNYQNLVQGIASAPRPGQSAPVVTPSGGGGIPVQNTNPADLPDAERKAHGAEIIRRLREQR